MYKNKYIPFIQIFIKFYWKFLLYEATNNKHAILLYCSLYIIKSKINFFKPKYKKRRLNMNFTILKNSCKGKLIFLYKFPFIQKFINRFVNKQSFRIQILTQKRNISRSIIYNFKKYIAFCICLKNNWRMNILLKENIE